MKCKKCGTEINKDNITPSFMKRKIYICKECQHKYYKELRLRKADMLISRYVDRLFKKN